MRFEVDTLIRHEEKGEEYFIVDIDGDDIHVEDQETGMIYIADEEFFDGFVVVNE